MIIGVDPKVDYAFKHLFGRESTRAILIDLVDSVLSPMPGHQITHVELLNPFNAKEALNDKLSILDIKARDQTGRQLNIEMQMLAYRHYEKRILYYWARFHQQQLHQGEDYLQLKRTVSINFLDHVLFPALPDYHLRFRLLEEAHHVTFSEDIEVHVLELPKFRKSAVELVSGLDTWLYFLRHAEKMDTEALPAALQQPLVKRALEELIMLTQTEQDRERYEARRKWQLDYNTGLKAARIEGEEAGFEKGRQEGRQEGLVGIVQYCQRLLGRQPTPAEELRSLPLEELTRLAEDLQEEGLKVR